MKRFFALVLALGVCLFSVTALAEGKLTVTEKNLIEFEGSSNAYFFAKLRKPVRRDGSHEEVFLPPKKRRIHPAK